MDQLSAAIEKGDEASVKKAAEEMKALAERMKNIKPTPEEDKALKEKYEPEMKKSIERMMTAMGKHPEMAAKMGKLGANPFGK